MTDTPQKAAIEALNAAEQWMDYADMGRAFENAWAIHGKTITDALNGTSGWLPIESAPRDGTIFVCRRKERPHVTFESSKYLESDGWENNHKSYYVLANETNEDDILDDAWEAYEWQPIILTTGAK